MQRVRGCEILPAALALALLLAAGLSLSGAVAFPAPAGEPQPAHAVLVGALAHEHAVAPASGATHPTVGKFVAVLPTVDAAGGDPVCAAGAQVVTRTPAFSAPLARSVRAPPGRFGGPDAVHTIRSPVIRRAPC